MSSSRDLEAISLRMAILTEFVESVERIRKSSLIVSSSSDSLEGVSPLVISDKEASSWLTTMPSINPVLSELFS